MLRLTLSYTVHTEGFAVIDEFLLPEECDELIHAMGEFTTTSIPDAQKHVFSTTDPDHKHARDQYFLESNDKIRPFFEKDALDEKGNLIVPPSNSLNKVGHALHLLHPLFRCYTYSDRVKKVCVDLGFKVPAVAQSMVIYKNPGIGGEVIPHQDATFLYTEPKPTIGFWIALEDATIDNGCLWVARGSHKSGVHRRMLRNPDISSEDLMIFDNPAPIYPDSIFTPVPVKKGMVGYCRLSVRRDVALVKYMVRVLRGELHHPAVLAALRLRVPNDYLGARRRPAMLEDLASYCMATWSTRVQSTSRPRLVQRTLSTSSKNTIMITLLATGFKKERARPFMTCIVPYR